MKVKLNDKQKVLHERAVYLHEHHKELEYARVVSILSHENAEELIEFAVNHSKREIEDEVVKRNPKAKTKGSIRAQSEEYDVVKVNLGKAVTKNLRRVQSLNPLKDLAEVMEEMIEVYLDYKDPVRKAERAEKRAAKSRANEQKTAQPSTAEAEIGKKSERLTKHYARAEKAKRVDLNAKQSHAANYRDRGCCTFIDAEGKRCNSDRWVEIHHKVSVADGGSNDPANFTTLCAFHHDLTHQLSLPIDGQITWLR